MQIKFRTGARCKSDSVIIIHDDIMGDRGHLNPVTSVVHELPGDLLAKITHCIAF